MAPEQPDPPRPRPAPPPRAPRPAPPARRPAPPPGAPHPSRVRPAPEPSFALGPVREATVVGPLAAVVGVDGEGTRLSRPDGDPLSTANALLVLRRCAVAKPQRSGRQRTVLDATAVREWATRTNLGQLDAHGTPSALVKAVAARRFAAMMRLAGPTAACYAVRLSPEGPVLVGAADRGIADVGMSLHGTYGWPVVPGSSLKGLTQAYARDEERLPDDDLRRLFGSPRPGDDTVARRGAVGFLDALPMRGDLQLREDVLTPHAKEYYIDGKPPAEYWQPVPVPFLSIIGGEWITFCVGEKTAAEQAAVLLADAAVTLGVGAKTSAGYGYMTESVARPILVQPSPAQETSR